MLVSLKNVNQYVSLEGLSPEEIAKKLTFAGVEVEEIRRLASGTNLVIGEIKECEKLYISSDILLTAKQVKIFKDNNIEVFIIPEYYYICMST